MTADITGVPFVLFNYTTFVVQSKLYPCYQPWPLAAIVLQLEVSPCTRVTTICNHKYGNNAWKSQRNIIPGAPLDGDYCKALRKAKQSRVVSVQNVKQ